MGEREIRTGCLDLLAAPFVLSGEDSLHIHCERSPLGGGQVSAVQVARHHERGRSLTGLREFAADHRQPWLSEPVTGPPLCVPATPGTTGCPRWSPTRLPGPPSRCPPPRL